MPVEKPVGREAVREAIIETTARMVADRGVAGVSFRDIGKAANVNHGLITRHFGTKERLIRETTSYLAHSLFHGPLSQGGSAIDFWIRNAGAPSRELRALVRIILEDQDRALLEENRPLVEDLLNWVKSEQEKENIDPDLDPVILLFLFVSVLVGNELFGPYLKDLLHYDEAEFQGMQPKLVQMFLSGFRKAT